jgi:tetratricopeptide (TPR) repeat protein
MSDLGPRSFRRGAFLLLLAASLLVACLALHGDVLSYDDTGLLYGSSGGRGALQRGPASFFGSELFYFAYLPFYGLSYWVDGLFGADHAHTFLFHLQNVLWHAATSYLVFLLLGILVRHRWAALLGALLFAVHPLHVESVAWIAGRKELLSGFFLFLAWLFALKAEERSRGWFLAAALAAFLVACFSKASAVVLPVLLLATALLLPRYAGRRREAALATWPFFAVAVVPVIVHLAVGFSVGVVVSESRPLDARLLAWVASWGASVYRTVLPFDLSIDYPEARAPGAGALVLAGLLLLGALAAFLAARRRAPVVAFGIAAFFVALLPFNNVFPATEVLAADRYLYLSLFGAAAVAAWAVRSWRRGTAVLAVVVLLCTGLSVASGSRFRSDEELWTRTIAARDASALAYFNRGAARVNLARTATPRDPELLGEGLKDLRAALSRAVLEEHRAKANRALVVPLLETGEIAEALERADDALAILGGISGKHAKRFKAQVLYERGAVHKDGRRAYAAAAKDFHAAARLQPRYRYWAEAGQAYLASGQLDAARHALNKAAAHDRTRPEPFLDLALLAARLGNREAQQRALQDAARRAPRDAQVVEAWVNFWLNDEAPNYLKAKEELERLPERAPARRALEAGVEAQRALYLFRRRELEPAVAAADRACALGLDSRALHDVAQVYVAAGRYDDAVRCYRGAADILARRSVHRDAVARAYALKSHQLLGRGDEAGAQRAMRAALDARPDLIEAGAAPLRGEIEELRRTRRRDLVLLAAAAVAGDPARGEDLAARLLDEKLPEREHLLVYRLRALLRAFSPPYRFPEAEDDLRQVLARDEKDLWARYRLAQIWIRSGVTWMRTGQAIDSEARVEQGRELLRRAIALLSRLIEEAPDFAHARLQRGEARFASDDLIGAKADYSALRERGVRLREVYLKEAVLHRLGYVRGGDVSNLQSAIELCRRALEIDANYFDALYELGNLYHLFYDRQDDPSAQRKLAFSQAIFWYRRAMALNPRLREPRLEWARLCLKVAREAAAAGHVKRAHDLVTRVEEDAADIVDVWRERVRLNMRPDFTKQTGLLPDEVFATAERALERIATLAPKDPQLPALRALFHRTRGYSFYYTWMRLSAAKNQPERTERARQLAVEEFKQAFLAWPKDPENASVRDRLRQLAPDMIEIDRQMAEKAYRRGEQALEERRWKAAAEAFHEAVLLFPESVHFRYAHAVARLKTGEKEKAKEELVRVANHPDGNEFPEACYELAKLYVSRGEKLIARTWLHRFVRTMEEVGRGDEASVDRARRMIGELDGN